MNCIIIDDDKLSRRIVEEFILKTEGLNLKHSFSDAVEAINVLKADEEIHLIFLDIEMPEMSGIDFLNSLKNPPQIIIVSSKGKYALDAFEYDVTDYLLKPVTYSRFYKAVDKAVSRFEKNKSNILGKEEIFIKKNSTLVRLKYDEILWVEALENYVIFNTFKDKYTIHFTMKAIEQKLPTNKFTRVHRSYIVNVKLVDKTSSNQIEIEKTKIPLGRVYKKQFQEAFLKR